MHRKFCAFFENMKNVILMWFGLIIIIGHGDEETSISAFRITQSEPF